MDRSRLWYALAVAAALLGLLIVARADAHPHPREYPARYTYDTALWTPQAAQVRTLIGYHSTKAALFPETAGIPQYWTPPPPEKPVRSEPRRNARPDRGFRAGVEQWRPLVEKYFPPNHVRTALRVMQCESGGNPDANNNRSSASGLFQHLGKYWGPGAENWRDFRAPGRAEKAGWKGADIYDPEANIAVAAWLVLHGGGWGHWTCY